MRGGGAVQHDYLYAAVLLGAVSVGVGVVLLAAQSRTRATLGTALSYISLGLSIPLATYRAGDVGTGWEPLARAEGLLEVATSLTSALYISGLAATAEADPRTDRRLRLSVRAIVGISAVIAIVGLVDPRARLNDFELQGLDTDAYHRPGFWVFALLWLSVTPFFMYSYRLLARARLDPGEKVRATCSFIGSPVLVIGLVMPRPVVLASLAFVLVVVLYGQVRHAIAQGERAVFLSRFLSPHVAEQVRTDGLTSVMEPGELEVTVVACDLRGFTSYAEAVPSQAVIDLLNEYYDAVGEAVAEVDGTIKDYAGDGILVLVGAPLPRTDHAEAGLALARRIHEVTAPVIARWSTGPHPLGIGVGAASGRVTVGAIGSPARMEYTAVGSAVNLAARLCSAAASGETLVDERVAAAGSARVVARDPMDLKGFAAGVAVFALDSDAEPRAVAGEPLP